MASARTSQNRQARRGFRALFRGHALGGERKQGCGTNNLVLNCDSYQNNDILCNGENADGFAAKENTGAATGNVFRGCRAWDNADDGWDLYGWSSPVQIERCWAFNQVVTTEGTASDGNGFKLGGGSVLAAHVLVDLYAVGNANGASACGFTADSNPASMTCTGSCGAWGNGTDVNAISGISTTPVINANISSMAAASARNADGSLKAITAL